MLTLLSTFLVLAAGSPAARANSLCEIEALKSGGRTYLKLVRSGLAQGDLEAKDLEPLLTSLTPQHPVEGTREITTQSLRDGFIRAMKHLRAGEWPLIQEEIRKILKRVASDQKLVDVAKEFTKDNFDLTDTNYALDKGEVLKHTFVSAKGEIYFFTGDKDGAHLRELHSRSKVQVSEYILAVEGAFMSESSTHGVLASFIEKSHDVKILRVSDKLNLFHYDLREIEQLKPYFESGIGTLDTRVYEADGRLKVAVFLKEDVVGTKQKTRFVVVFDAPTKAYEVFEFPNVSLKPQVGPDGNLYALGVGKSKKRANVAFIFDFRLGKNSFHHQYAQNHPIAFEELRPRLTFDREGRPQIHLVWPRNFSIFRLDTETTNVYSVGNSKPGNFSHYVGPDGKIHAAFIDRNSEEHIFSFGDFQDPSRANIPVASQFSPQRLDVVETFFGQMAVVWAADKDNNLREAYLTKFDGSWVYSKVDGKLNYQAVKEPFFDPRTKSTLVFIGKDKVLKLYKLYGSLGN